MSDWFQFEAIIRDKREKPEHSPLVFPVHVWGVTETTARDKLIGEYPKRYYEIESFRLIAGDGGMHLSDPDSFKGPKGPTDT